MDLFSESHDGKLPQEPLAVRMRPQSLTEFSGQQDVLAKGRFLREMIERDNVPSIILFGPPGSGKTTLAQIIANTTQAIFEKINAVTSGVSDIRRITEAARERLLLYRRRTVLFIDEIHRFNKAQQDALLPFVENGTVILIGATTENPYFEVNSPLLSRVRVIRLHPLDRNSLKSILRNALADERGLGNKMLTCSDETFGIIADIANGDARTALNILEQASYQAEAKGEETITDDSVTAVASERMYRYDKNGDNHYDTVSAFIKSMRGSDPDAAVHYLARMIEAGEDIKFIARRIVICAAEDVGLADPQALPIAMAAAQAVQFLGLPEARIPLAQAVIYIATAPKSNAAYEAIDKAIFDIRSRDIGGIPPHLRDGSYAGAKKLGHGQGYRYPHDYPGGYTAQQYLPAELKGTRYYHPKQRGFEKTIGEWLGDPRKS